VVVEEEEEEEEEEKREVVEGEPKRKEKSREGTRPMALRRTGTLRTTYVANTPSLCCMSDHHVYLI